MNLKKMIINTLIALVITMFVFLLIFLILNHLDGIVKIFTQNTYVISYFKDIVDDKKEYPFIFVFILLLINVVLCLFRSKQKLIMTILIVLVNLAAFIGIFMFTKVDRQYVMQIIDEIKSYL